MPGFPTVLEMPQRRREKMAGAELSQLARLLCPSQPLDSFTGDPGAYTGRSACGPWGAHEAWVTKGASVPPLISSSDLSGESVLQPFCPRWSLVHFLPGRFRNVPFAPQHTHGGSSPSPFSCYCHSWWERMLSNSISIWSLAQQLTSHASFNRRQTQRPPPWAVFNTSNISLISLSKSRSDSPHIKETFPRGRGGRPWSSFYHLFLKSWETMWAGAGRGGAVNQAWRMKPFPRHCSSQPLSCSCWGGCFLGWGGVSGCC